VIFVCQISRCLDDGICILSPCSCLWNFCARDWSLMTIRGRQVESIISNATPQEHFVRNDTGFRRFRSIRLEARCNPLRPNRPKSKDRCHKSRLSRTMESLGYRLEHPQRMSFPLKWETVNWHAKGRSTAGMARGLGLGGHDRQRAQVSDPSTRSRARQPACTAEDGNRFGQSSMNRLKPRFSP
jgi:hypothetical protein